MRLWNLQSGARLPFILVADMRLGETNYCNDQSWELVLGKGEPPALAIMTSYGLRARMLRIFPRFIENEVSIIDPAKFPIPVSVRQFFPNFIKVTFSPFTKINVEIEYWVPNSQVVAARTKITNTSSEVRTIRLEWVTALNPLPGGQRMTPIDFNLTHALTGKTENISPVFLMSNNAKSSSGPFTSLTLSQDVVPKESIYITWALASLDNIEASYQLAQKTLERNWDAEMARIMQVNAEQIEIYTGDPDWDVALALAQYRANSLLLQKTNKLSHSSFVSNRLPDQGYSYRGDGSDYSHQWNGQTPLETFYLTDLLLPGNAEIAQGLLLNFLNTQTNEGFVDWKPGLSGQRSQILATPLLSSMAWRIYQANEDKDFLTSVFPRLLKFLQSWFIAAYDRDGDGIPEWSHSLQTGLDEHPLFSYWETWSAGINISSVEAPDLCAFLYQECTLLIQIAQLVNRNETIPALQALADHLHTAVEAAWNEDCACYQYWDRESHSSSAFEILGTRTGSGDISIQRGFENPIRLLLHIRSNDETTRPLQIYIHGTTPSGGHRVEKISNEDIRWHLGRCRITSERIYSALEYIEINGLNETDEVQVQTIGHTEMDITTLLPLWAGMPSEERAKSMIARTVTNPKLFWGRYGIRSSGETLPHTPGSSRHYNYTHIPYNCLIGSGLYRYGQVRKAAELVSRIMKAVIQSLHKDGFFYRVYNSNSGMGIGERNALSGLPPVGLFLKVLGVRIIKPNKVILSGTNPYPWPVTVKYRGLSVSRQKNKTMVIFPNGQTIIVKNGKTQVVELE